MKKNNFTSPNEEAVTQDIKQKIETGQDINVAGIAFEEIEKIVMQLGEEYYKKGDSINALNCFNRILTHNPQNQKAKTYSDMIVNVLNYYNKDLLNP